MRAGLERVTDWSGCTSSRTPDFAQAWREARPRSTFLNFLVTGRSDRQETFYKVSVWGLSTAEKEVAKDLAVVGEIQVPGITLDDLLERRGVAEIDLLSIDVEGHQRSVLAGLDLPRWRPKLVCIEDDGLFAVPWFKARGYAPIERYRFRDVVNWYFAPEASAAAANARETDRGREEARKREALLAGAPPGSPAHAFTQPTYVLGPDGLPVRNPRVQEPGAAAGTPPPGPVAPRSTSDPTAGR